MQESAFESWISKLSERDFDAPFLALLRTSGFYDIHFTHGAYEFGKDFIAKRDEPATIQYAIQSKAGNVGGKEWTSILGQLEELTDEFLAHPNFDSMKPTTFVLLMTGRLVGKAVVGTSAFKKRLEKQNRGTFEVWDTDTLIELLGGSSRFPGGVSSSFHRILGKVFSGIVTERELEEETAKLALMPERDALKGIVDCSIVAAVLEEKGSPFAALSLGLAAVRIAACLAHRDTEHLELLKRSMDAYVARGERLLAPFLDCTTTSRQWVDMVGAGPGVIFTYPLACTRIFEFCGLASLWLREAGDASRAHEFAVHCGNIVEHQPGVLRPVSDRCASSLAPGVLALHVDGASEFAASLLKGTAKWLCDIYEKSEFGLASTYASPAKEVDTLLGTLLEDVALDERRESLIAMALADLAYYVAPELYPLIINDLQAVGIYPSGLHALDEPQGFCAHGIGGSLTLPGPKYPDTSSSAALAHHLLQAFPRVVEKLSGPSVMLGLACLARDRLFADCYPRVVLGTDEP